MISKDLNKHSPIGVFDSGFGGLSAVRELRRILPNEDIVYFGDTARVPYGTRSHDTLIKYAFQDVNFLLSNNVKAIVIACGTVSSVAYDQISEYCSIPVVGIVEPACECAAELTENGVIGIWGTSATVRSGSFGKTLEKISKATDRRFTTKAVSCSLLVPLIENGYISDDCEILRLAVREYLNDIVESKADTLILGCTHYPLISSVIDTEWSRYGGGKLVNSGRQSAFEVKKRLSALGVLNDKHSLGTLRIYSSDDMSIFSNQAKIFMMDDSVFDEETEFRNVFFSPDKIDIENF